jgi:PDZ domain-containing secreted protein/Zn-dependent protease/CBS domain-containing protein
MTSSFTIIKVRGIPIGAHWSWLFVFALVVWSLSTSLFPITYPGLGDGTYLAMGIVAGALFFISVLLHELGHAFRALREGMKIDGITLWLVGGVARFTGTFPSPGAEFRIAAAGPAVSLVLVGVFLAASRFADALSAPDMVVAVADYLARINAIVVAFNLVPALPLDGGRILRSWLWRRQGDFVAATKSAVRAGMAFGVILAGVGLLDFLSGGGGAGGLWFVFLGWFIIQAAQGESSYAAVQQLLAGRRVREFMTPDPDVVDPRDSVGNLLDAAIGPRAHSAYPVVEAGRLVGMVGLRRAGTVPFEERAQKSVAEVMVPIEELETLRSDTEMMEALATLQEDPKRAPVLDDGRLIGIISLSDAVRAIEIESVRKPPESRRARSSGIAVWLIVGALILAAGGYLYHPPVVVLRPGITLDVAQDVSISGAETTPVNGEYLLTSVRLVQPNALGALWSVLFTDDQVVSASDVIPRGVDDREYFQQQREIFRQSEVISAGAAAKAAGMDVSVTGTGAVVNDVVSGAPAAQVLEPGDVVVAVNGDRVRLSTDFQRIVRSSPAGTEFDVTVERGSRTLDLRLRSTRLSGAAEGTVGIGVLITTRDFDVRLPFEIDFRARQIGGPSAGLIYALAITDLLDEQDYADGRKIAATGTMDIDGSVGAVGGVSPKAVSVEDAGADIFLVPDREVDDVSIESLNVRGVSDLEDALRALGGTASGWVPGSHVAIA